MKNLKRKYKKIELQRLKYRIFVKSNNVTFRLWNNLIGFEQEYYCPLQKDFKNNFYGYNHFVGVCNNKLYIKYPGGCMKKDYKKWLKNYK